MNKINPFLTIWFKPRKTLSYLDTQWSQFSFIKVIVGLALAFLLELIFFLWIIGCPPPPKSMIFSWYGIGLLFSVFFLFALILFTILNFSALAFYALLKFFRITVSINKIKITLLWSFICFVPSTFFFLLLCGTYRIAQSTFSKLSNFIQDFFLEFSIAGILFFIIYSLIVLAKGLSETIKLNIWKAISVVFIGSILSILFTSALLFFISSFF